MTTENRQCDSCNAPISMADYQLAIKTDTIPTGKRAISAKIKCTVCGHENVRIVVYGVKQ